MGAGNTSPIWDFLLAGSRMVPRRLAGATQESGQVPDKRMDPYLDSLVIEPQLDWDIRMSR